GGLAWWYTQRATSDNGNGPPVVTTSTGEATTEPTQVVSHQVTVAGNQAWTDAGASCEPGKSIQLVASRTVYHRPTTGGGPDGATNPDLHQFSLPGLSDANHSALVASLDKQGPLTVVVSASTYRAQAAGAPSPGP